MKSDKDCKKYQILLGISVLLFIIVIAGMCLMFLNSSNELLIECKERFQEFYDEGYFEGLTTGKKIGTNLVIDCMNPCNTGTGIINQCYSSDCINNCIRQ